MDFYGFTQEKFLTLISTSVHIQKKQELLSALRTICFPHRCDRRIQRLAGIRDEQSL